LTTNPAAGAAEEVTAVELAVMEAAVVVAIDLMRARRNP
jgi:hypothetical protein